MADSKTAQRLDQAALTELLDRVGPAVVVSHSAGGPAGFLAADARPDNVLAVVACEPLGPPFLGAPGMPLAWGVANAPLTYSPPATSVEDLAIEVDSSVGPIPMALQKNPPRTLSQMAGVPILLVTGEASPFRWLADHTRRMLDQAGCRVEAVNLWEHGLTGNGHGFPFERNHSDVLELLLRQVNAVTSTDSTTAESALIS